MKHNWFSGYGRIKLTMTLENAHSAYHQGQCDDDVNALSQTSEIAKQLTVIDPETLRTVLREYGAWNAEELSDHAQNLQRILWLAAADIIEEPELYV